MNGAIGRFLARWKRALLISSAVAVALVVIVLLAAPGIISSSVRARLATGLRESLRGGGDVGAVSFSWPCTLTVDDLRIRDARGADAIVLPRASARISVASLLGGTPSLRIEAEGATLTLAEDEDGRVSLAGLLKPEAPAGSPAGPGSSSGSRPASPFHAELLLTGTTLRCTGPASAPVEFRCPRLFLAVDRGDSGWIVASDRIALESPAGRAEIDVHLDLRNRADTTSTLALSLDHVDVALWLASWIRYVHPLFAAADRAGRRSLEGQLTARLDLAYRGALSAAALAEGWEPLPKAPVSGSAHVEGSGIGLRDNPTLAPLRDLLGQDVARDIKLNPVDVSIRGGRIEYDHPLRMHIAGEATTWTGSVGLDQSLDLVWNVPIGDGLAKKALALAAVKGTTLKIAVKGTLSRPDVQWKGAVTEAGKDRVRDGILALTGGKAEKEAGAVLAEADDLWAKDRKKEAAPLYRRLGNEFKKTAVYKGARERIKQREADQP